MLYNGCWLPRVLLKVSFSPCSGSHHLKFGQVSISQHLSLFFPRKSLWKRLNYYRYCHYLYLYLYISISATQRSRLKNKIAENKYNSTHVPFCLGGFTPHPPGESLWRTGSEELLCFFVRETGNQYFCSMGAFVRVLREDWYLPLKKISSLSRASSSPCRQKS